jgi:CubicO group peptidase (beta-lactamase class C family)
LAVFLPVVCGVIVISASAGALAANDAPVTAKIDSLVLAQVKGGVVPGIAVAITKNGKTIYVKSEGVRT